jgi:hypothetical protein
MRLLPVLALSAALATGACTNPDGSTDVPGTVALGAGALLATALIVAASSGSQQDNNYYGRPPRRGYGHGRPYSGGYGYGPPPRRSW